MVPPQLLDDDRYGAARVDDVLYEKDVAAGQWPLYEVGELDLARAGRPGAVAGGAHELQLGRDAEAAQQIGGKDGGAFEDDDHHERLVQVGIDVRYLVPQLAHPPGDAPRRDHRLAAASDGGGGLNRRD